MSASILPKSLSIRIRALAEEEGISAEEFIRLAVAEKAAEVETMRGMAEVYGEVDYMARRAAEARQREERTGVSSRERFLEILDKVPHREPAPEDRLPPPLQANEQEDRG